MTRDSIETAVREGIPFVINMADGKLYEVREEFKIAVGRTKVVVLDEPRPAARPSDAHNDWHQLSVQK